jgi:DNA-binding HxlR family transcriptional regulator
MISICNSPGEGLMDPVVGADDLVWTDRTCPVARTVDLVGDRWCLLIIRDAMDGAQSFSDFHHRTGIARNILTDRLRRLVDRGLLQRGPAPSGRRQIYALTEAGRDLFTVIVAMRQWGERHTFARDEPHSVLVDRSGRPLTQLHPTDSRGDVANVDTTTVLHRTPAASAPEVS